MNLTPHQPVEHFLPLQRHSQMLGRGMHILLGGSRIGMAECFLEDEGVATAGFGKSSRVRVSTRIENEFRGPVHFRSQRGVQVRQGTSGKVATFRARKHPFGIRKESEAEGKDFSGSLSLRKAPAGVRGLAVANGDAADIATNVASSGPVDGLPQSRCRRCGHTKRVHKFTGKFGRCFCGCKGFVVHNDIHLSQRHRFLGPESQVEHQDGHFSQRVFGGSEVSLFHFTVENERTDVLTRQGSYPAIPDQPAVVGKLQGFSQRSQFPVDGGDGQPWCVCGHMLFDHWEWGVGQCGWRDCPCRRYVPRKPRVLVSLYGQLVNLIEGERRERNVLAQAFNALFVKLSRAWLFRVLANRVEKRTLKKNAEDRRRRAFNEADTLKCEVRAVFGKPELGGFLVGTGRTSLIPLALVPEIELPETALFGQSHVVGPRCREERVCQTTVLRARWNHH